MPRNSNTPFIETRKISRTIKEGRALLKDINFEIFAGEKIRITGKSGSGKTTFLRSLIGLDSVDHGEIYWKGALLTPQSIPVFRRTAIYMHQHPSFIEGTVEENLRMPFQFRVSDDLKFHMPIIKEYLNELSLGEDFLSTNVSELSGGEAQIVALLRSIQLNPEALLLDEPTASLDASTKTTVETLIDCWFELDEASRCLIWISHDKTSKQAFDENYILSDGILQKATGGLP